MVPQPALPFDQLLQLHSIGEVTDTTICWPEGQYRAYRLFRELRAELAGPEKVSTETSPQEFVSTLGMPTLKHGQKPREYFQTATREELYDEVKRFLRDKIRRERELKD